MRTPTLIHRTNQIKPYSLRYKRAFAMVPLLLRRVEYILIPGVAMLVAAFGLGVAQMKAAEGRGSTVPMALTNGSIVQTTGGDVKADSTVSSEQDSNTNTSNGTVDIDSSSSGATSAETTITVNGQTTTVSGNGSISKHIRTNGDNTSVSISQHASGTGSASNHSDTSVNVHVTNNANVTIEGGT